ncbi:MAG: glycosyltransferase, partial [Candidatus Dormibacteraeota bacterium]|nr:glycosyltransferase [Candidatus Dormibacteraeota bacterium]
YKAGALRHGLASADGELIAIFDADFLPAPSFLRATVGPFADPGVGVVQTRWGFTDPARSLLTRVQALVIDTHFGIEQAGRNALGCFINFNGSAGVWRAAAIADAGGWLEETLTEDLDISYRAQLGGWRFVYLDDVRVPTELPQDLRSFRLQQYRWIKGVAQNAFRFASPVVRAPIPQRTKVHAIAQLFESCLYLVTLGVPLLSATIVLLAPPGLIRDAAAFPPIFLAGGLLMAIGYVRYVRDTLPAASVRQALGRWLAFFLVQMALSTHNTVAVLSGLTRSGGEFVRTPKRGDDPEHVSYVPPGLDRITAIELLVWLFLVTVLTLGASRGLLPLQWLALVMLGGITALLAASLRHALRITPVGFGKADNVQLPHSG